MKILTLFLLDHIPLGIEAKDHQILTTKTLLETLDKCRMYVNMEGAPFLALVFCNDMQARYFTEKKQGKKSKKSKKKKEEESSRDRFKREFLPFTAIFKIPCDSDRYVLCPLDEENCPLATDPKLVVILIQRERPPAAEPWISYAAQLQDMGVGGV